MFVCVCTILLLLLLLLLQFVLLLEVDVGRLHSDDGFVQKTEGFLHMFGLHLKTQRQEGQITHNHINKHVFTATSSRKLYLAPTSSQQCMRAMPSERRIMLSSCRTVILQADLDTPPEPSRWRRRLYCSTMNSSDSLEIYRGTRGICEVQYKSCQT